jgi:hypothetical protein
MFIFDKINFPDSTTNEKESQGFISFKISPIDSIVPNTKIENYADIYFDFNSPIRTDTAIVTALDTIIVSTKNIIVTEELSFPLGVAKNDLSVINIFPNPTNDYISVEGANKEFNIVKIYDNKGSLLIYHKLSNDPPINVQSLSNGVYFIHLSNKKGSSYIFKMIKK